MKKIEIACRKYLIKVFRDTPDQKITDSINIRNIRSVYVFSVIACIFDTVTLALFAATRRGEPRFWQIFFNVSCCVLACALIIVLSRGVIRRYERDGTISNIRTNTLVTLFYIVLSAWGIVVDVEHYAAGEQMLTFYIVQFCFVCFVVMPPKSGSVIIALSFSTLYLHTYFLDGAAEMQPQNYVIFSVIAIFGNAIQYMMLLESEKQKSEIMELNQILQQQALVDDLTELKNRNALRGDFERYIGKYAYVIMADVDHFKLFNDTYGHPVGDSVLRLIAAATMEVFRGEGTYRYGGDEFLILLSDHTDEEFTRKLNQWKGEIQSIRIPDVTQPISCSCGYERCLLKSADDLRNAIKTADDRLYEAKKKESGNSILRSK